MGIPLIEFRDVSKSFGEKKVLDGVNLKVYPGEVTTIIGKSGVGKSVTLKLMIGLERPDSGEILYNGRSIFGLSKRQRREITGEINFMFQNNALFDSLTVYENIALPLQETTRLSSREIRDRVMEKMEALELVGQEDKYPSQLSGGMQKRVALARALVTNPRVVLFDEPTTGLDPVRRNSVLSMITHNQQNFGFTAVLVSHDVPHVFYISNRIAVIDGGRIIFEGSPMELELFSHPVVHEFINSLEFLKNQIVGVRTRRDFERFFREEVEGKEGRWTIVVFLLQNYNLIIEKVGHLVPHYIFSELVGMCKGFCVNNRVVFGRYSFDKVVLLTEKSPQEVDQVLSSIGEQLKEKDFFNEYAYTDSCVEFSIEAGLVEYQKLKRLYELVDEALSRSRVLARLFCGKKSRGEEDV